MATQIQLTRSGTPGAQPTATEMELGELALNYADGKLYFKNDSNNIEQLNSTYNNSGQKIFVNEADNYIGLNTISPGFLLDLGGDTASDDNTLRLNQNDDGTAIRIGGSAAGDITLLRVDNADGETANSAEGFSIKYLGSNDHELGIFADNTSSEVQALTILQDGNIGIGQTTPVEKLHIGGTARTSQLLIGDEWDTETPDGGQNLYIKDLAVHSSYDPFGSGADVDSNDNYSLSKDKFPLIISVDDDQTEGPNSHGIVLYNANGGAGTFAPSILFASRESDGTDYRSAAAGIYCRSPLGTGGASGGSNYTDGELIFSTSGTLNGSTNNSQGVTQRMVIDRAGKVGINTTTPTEVLDVDGNAAVSGDITATGNIAATDITATGDIIATGNVTASSPTADTHLTTKTYVDNTYQPGQIVQQFYHRVDDVLVYGIDGTSGKLNATSYRTPGQTNFRIIDLQGLNFISGSGGTARSLYAINMEDFEISITPKYSNSLIVVEYNICGETGSANTGMWMGEVNSNGAAQVITRSGYEGYNPNAPVGYNNSYFSDFYDGNDSSTLANHVITYIDKPNTTSQKTYVPIYHSIHGDLSNREFHLNRTVTLSTAYDYEYGVSNMSIKEIRQ